MRFSWSALALVCTLAAACSGGSSSSAPAAIVTPTHGASPRPVLAPAPPSPSAGSSPQALASPSATRSLMYVAVGASDTVGVGATNPLTEGWVPRLAQKLGPNVGVLNLGVSGTLIHAALQDQLPRAIRAQPDLVTVWLAVNDLNAHVPLEQYAADLNTLLDGLASQTRAAVLVANVPDLTLVPAYHDVPAEQLTAEVQRWNAAIADAAQRHHARLVDLFREYAELAANPTYLSSDGFHPSSAGYARIADLFYAEFQAVSAH